MHAPFAGISLPRLSGIVVRRFERRSAGKVGLGLDTGGMGGVIGAMTNDDLIFYFVSSLLTIYIHLVYTILLLSYTDNVSTFQRIFCTLLIQVVMKIKHKDSQKKNCIQIFK